MRCVRQRGAVHVGIHLFTFYREGFGSGGSGGEPWRESRWRRDSELLQVAAARKVLLSIHVHASVVRCAERTLLTLKPKSKRHTNDLIVRTQPDKRPV